MLGSVCPPENVWKFIKYSYNCPPLHCILLSVLIAQSFFARQDHNFIGSVYLRQVNVPWPNDLIENLYVSRSIRNISGLEKVRDESDAMNFHNFQ